MQASTCFHASSHLLAARRPHSFVPMQTPRHRILLAAVRVYAEVGFRGATTRRIAEEAGVNEVTLFRLFGSKAALIDEALKSGQPGEQRAELPKVPGNPEAEITEWATVVLEHLHTNRSIIRTMMSEMGEHPDLAHEACEGPRCAFEGLYAYTSRLRDRGVTLPDPELRGAVAMLIGALFADAMGRDMMPRLYRLPRHKAAAMSVRFFLRAIGYPVAGAGVSTATRAKRRPVRRAS